MIETELATAAFPKNRVEVLQRLEVFSYQIAFYLLGDEGLAAEAAKRALLEAGLTTAFLAETADVQREMMKRYSIKHSLGVKAERLSKKLIDNHSLMPL